MVERDCILRVPYDLSSGAKNFSLNALENALKQENGYLSVVSNSEIKEAVESPGAMEKARKNFCKKYKDITLSFEEGKETHGSVSSSLSLRTQFEIGQLSKVVLWYPLDLSGVSDLLDSLNVCSSFS